MPILLEHFQTSLFMLQDTLDRPPCRHTCDQCRWPWLLGTAAVCCAARPCHEASLQPPDYCSGSTLHNAMRTLPGCSKFFNVWLQDTNSQQHVASKHASWPWRLVGSAVCMHACSYLIYVRLAVTPIPWKLAKSTGSAQYLEAAAGPCLHWTLSDNGRAVSTTAATIARLTARGCITLHIWMFTATMLQPVSTCTRSSSA